MYGVSRISCFPTGPSWEKKGLTQPVPGPGQTPNCGPPLSIIDMSNLKGLGSLYFCMFFKHYLSFCDFFKTKNIIDVLFPGPLRAPGPGDFAPLAPP